MHVKKHPIISEILKNRITSLGYPSLRRFYDDRPDLGVSYELLRQLVHDGRLPKTDTFQRILSSMRFSPPQWRKILELANRQAQPPARGAAAASAPPPAEPSLAEAGPAADLPTAARPEAPGRTEPPAADAPALARELSFGDLEEISQRLSTALSRVPFRGHEDFWETVRHVALLAERKVRELSARAVDQPLLFETEPEAIYHFLVRTGKIVPYMSRGEAVPLEFAKGIDYRDRYRGALLGAAVGEMLGRPAQGLSPRDVAELYGDLGEYPPGGRAAGRHRLRDSPLPSFRLLLRSLREKGALDPKAAAGRYAGAAEAAAPGALAEFARNLRERGYPWFEAGIAAPESLPAARIVPLALLRAGDFRRLKLEAGIDAAVTHPNPAAVAGAIAHAVSIARVLHTPAGTLDVLGFGRALSAAISGIESDRSARVRPARPGPSLFRKLGTELPALLMRRAPIGEIRDALGNGPAAVEGIPFAWAGFLRAPSDFAEVVLSAARLGQDAMATASMAGALCGAYAGAAAIPPAWLAELEGRQELETAADALLESARRTTSA